MEINRNAETCIGAQFSGVAAWWYHKKSIFKSGDIPDNLVIVLFFQAAYIQYIYIYIV